MSKQVELVLYLSARSFEEYSNRATLMKRVQEATQRIIESFAKKDGDRLGPSQVIDLTGEEEAMTK
jgi:hypothetical protein